MGEFSLEQISGVADIAKYRANGHEKKTLKRRIKFL